MMNKQQQANLDALQKRIVEAIQMESCSRERLIECGVAIGRLVLEAYAKHPTRRKFEGYMRCTGLTLKRCIDLMHGAAGHQEAQKLQKQLDDARDRQRKHRDLDSLPPPEGGGVTGDEVTPMLSMDDAPSVDAAVSAEARGAEYDNTPERGWTMTSQLAAALDQYVAAHRAFNSVHNTHRSRTRADVRARDRASWRLWHARSTLDKALGFDEKESRRHAA